MPQTDETPESRPTFAQRLFGLLSWAVPAAVALSRLAPLGRWEGDVGALRDVALVSVGLGGGVSTALAQMFRLLPLGSLSFRAALVGVVAVGMVGRLVFAFGLRLLDVKQSPRPWLAPALAAVAALSTALAPSFQREATIDGGRVLGVALLLVTVLAAQRLVVGEAKNRVRELTGLGLVLGMALAEEPAAGLLSFLCLGAALAFAGEGAAKASRAMFPRRSMFVVGAAFTVGLLFFCVPPIARGLSPRVALDLGMPLTSRALGVTSKSGLALGTLEGLAHEVGVVSLCLAIGGAGAALLRRRTRWQVAPLLVFVALDAAIPLGLLKRLPLASVVTFHLAAVAVLSTLAVSGVFASVNKLLTMRFPMAKPLAWLSVAFHATLVALLSEQASAAADRASQRGADEWTDVALGTVDPASALVAGDPARMLRLSVAQLTEGQRPDVMVVAWRTLGRGSVAADLSVREPATEPLIRAVSITGVADEFSLSHLADARPLYVELDPRWTVQETAHLTISGLWLRYAPQPLGTVDRKSSTASLSDDLERFLAIVAPDGSPDPESLRVARSVVGTEVALLSRLGDIRAAGSVLAAARRAHLGILDGASLTVLVADLSDRAHRPPAPTPPPRREAAARPAPKARPSKPARPKH